MRRAAALGALALAACTALKGPPKAGECKSNLVTALAGEAALYSEQHRYTVHPLEAGFSPSGGNRYLYLFAAVGEVTRRDGRRSPGALESVGVGPDTRARQVTAEWLRERLPANVAAMLGVHGECPACTVVLGCVGNLDDDETVDVWTISSHDRTDPAGYTVLRGVPWHHVDDAKQ